METVFKLLGRASCGKGSGVRSPHSFMMTEENPQNLLHTDQDFVCRRGDQSPRLHSSIHLSPGTWHGAIGWATGIFLLVQKVASHWQVLSRKT
jgi:hypothetical protein